MEGLYILDDATVNIFERGQDSQNNISLIFVRLFPFFLFFFFKNLLIYLVLVVAHRIFFSCGMWSFSCGMKDLVPWLGIKLRPPAVGAQSLRHWEPKALATGPPGKSLLSSFLGHSQMWHDFFLSWGGKRGNLVTQGTCQAKPSPQRRGLSYAGFMEETEDGVVCLSETCMVL